jgi:hypothetical protein
MNGKHNLIIDGNFFIFKTLFVLPRPKKGKLLGDEEQKAVFIRKLALDFASEIKKFNRIINRVVFTLDSNSWRKDFYPEADYKGHRKADDSVEWDAVWDCAEKFTNIIKEKNVIISRVQGAEGDDLIFAWCNFLRNESENCIINSGDRDLTQLVLEDKSTNTYNIFYTNTQKVLIGYQGFEKWLNSTNENLDIFNIKKSSKDRAKDTLNQVITLNKLTVTEVDPNMVSFEKVICGDKGDNIMPIYSYTTPGKNGKSGRTYGISKKKFELIHSEFEQKFGEFKDFYLFNEDYKKEIVKIVMTVVKPKHMTYDKILSNLDLNINLVLLHSQIIPKSIQEEMFKSIEKDFEHDTPIFEELNSMKEILKDTDYIDEDYVPSNMKVFRDNSKPKKEKDFSFIKDRKKQNKANTKSLF